MPGIVSHSNRVTSYAWKEARPALLELLELCGNSILRTLRRSKCTGSKVRTTRSRKIMNRKSWCSCLM